MESEETLDLHSPFQSQFQQSSLPSANIYVSGHFNLSDQYSSSFTDGENNGEAEDDDDDDDEQTRICCEWGKLPQVVLVQVFSYLSDNDRLSMSLVCSSWALAFDHPCLWRTRVYHFGSGMSNMNEGQRAIGFALRHGEHLRRLTIRCDHPTYGTCKKFQRTMTTFLHLLGRRTKLRTLSIPQLYAERYWRYETIRSKLLVSLAYFLKGQRHLEVVDFSDALFSVHSGLKVLEALGKGAGRKLKLFIMEDFFVTKVAVFRIGRYRLAIRNFRFLHRLHMNYSYLSEDIIETLAETCARNLQFLSIKVCRHDPHFHIISNDTWCSLRRACPMLKVSLFFEGIGIIYSQFLKIGIDTVV